MVSGMILFAFMGVAPRQGTIDVALQWAFPPDEKNVGISEGWQASTYDDSAWAKIAAGRQWETLCGWTVTAIAIPSGVEKPAS